MASIVEKKIKGKTYLYLVHSVRKDNRVIQKVIKYIGPKRPIPKEEFECMGRSYNDEDWILTDRKDELSYQEHHRLQKASTQREAYLTALDLLSQEKEEERFLATFIAHSNAIEGSTLNPKETFDFLFNDIVPEHHAKKELFMAQNMLEAWQFLKKNSHRFPTHQDLCELHRRINKNIESEETLGTYKKRQNYIGDVLTTSYLFTKEKMERLFHWIKNAYRRVDDFEVAFQSHAQFEIIHPFIDGNGRVGRLLLNWLLLHKGKMPLAIDVQRRSGYINALQNAQRGKIEAICQFCCKEYLEQYAFVESE